MIRSLLFKAFGPSCGARMISQEMAGKTSEPTRAVCPDACRDVRYVRFPSAPRRRILGYRHGADRETRPFLEPAPLANICRVGRGARHRAGFVRPLPAREPDDEWTRNRNSAVVAG